MQDESTVLSDMAHVEKALVDDFSGDDARAMMAYFEDVARAAEGRADAQTQEFAYDLAAGLRAARLIVKHVWESLHSAALPV